MTENYRNEAESDARDAIEHFMDEIIEFLVDGGKTPIWPLNDISGFDSYHHESHVDKDYNLQEAASLLDELDDYEETDEGLWQGVEPRRAISCQAAYTYGNAVLNMVQDYLKDVTEDDDIMKLAEIYQEIACLNDSEYQRATLKSTKDELGRLVKELIGIDQPTE